jgi:single-strand DNA-binding protein
VLHVQNVIVKNIIKPKKNSKRGCKILNKIAIVARLTRDPELRYTPSGAAVCNLRLASNHYSKSKTGEKKEEVCFITAVVWSKRAENCNQYLKKGSAIFVEGRLQSRSWENAQGAKQYAIEIFSEDIQFLDRVKEGTSLGVEEEAHPESGSFLDESQEG